MKHRAAVLGALVALVAALIAGFLGSPESVRDGQLVFVVSASSDVPELGQDVTAIEILSCTETAMGLRISGRATAGRGALVPVMVTTGDPKGAGRGTSSGFAANAERLPDAALGDFLIVLPWASPTSTFAVASARSLGNSDGGLVTGDVARCPIEEAAAPTGS